MRVIMKNKIGIITFHKACNYGAVLQTYALQTKLKEVFCDNEIKIIDYYCPAIEDRTSPYYFVKDGNVVKNVLRYIYLFLPKYKKYKLFSKFRKEYLQETEIRYNGSNFSSLGTDYLAIFTGSDQVWNLKSTGVDTTYFLQQLGDNTLKCSYAASFGFDEIVKDYYSIIPILVRRLDYISLREKIGVDDLFKKNNISASVHVDPTMLLTSSDWDRLLDNTKKVIREEYILLYCILKTKRLINYAKKLSVLTGLPVYSISNHSDFSDFIQLRSLSVEEFVSLIKNAKYVLTTSFHGTVFSILYHKQFVTEIDTDSLVNTRVDNLLDILDIKNRAVDHSSFEIDSSIEWENIDCKLRSYVKDTEKYLNTIKNRIKEINRGE